MDKKICFNCKKAYIGRGIKFCSKECWNEWQKGKEKLNLKGIGVKPLKTFKCKNCGKIWRDKRWKVRTFCSHKCADIYNGNVYKGHEVSLKTRKKISATLQNIPLSKWTEFTQKEIIRLRDSKEYNEWRKAIYKQDNYICQICKKHGGILHAHHILKFSKYPNKRFNIDNGITLCQSCHNKITQLEKRGMQYEFKK